MSTYLFIFGLDRPPARREALQSQADRTAKLAPNSLEAEIATAQARNSAGQDRLGLQRRLEGLVEKYPRDLRLLRELARTYDRDGKFDQAVEANKRALALAPDDPRLKADLVNIFIGSGRFAEADIAIAQALQGRAGPRILAFDVMNKLTWTGDLAVATVAVENWPGWFLFENRGCYLAAAVHLWSHRPKQALDILNRFPRDYIRNSLFSAPKAALTGLAHEMAGDPKNSAPL